MVSKLRQLRIDRNVSVHTLIELLGITHPTYYKKELGRLRFNLNEAKILSEYFNTEINDIFFDSESSKKEHI